MRRHSWCLVGLRSMPEYVGSMTQRKDVPVSPATPLETTFLMPRGSSIPVYLCQECRSYASGDEERVNAEPCDVAAVRRIMGL